VNHFAEQQGEATVVGELRPGRRDDGLVQHVPDRIRAVVHGDHDVAGIGVRVLRLVPCQPGGHGQAVAQADAAAGRIGGRTAHSGEERRRAFVDVRDEMLVDGHTDEDRRHALGDGVLLMERVTVERAPPSLAVLAREVRLDHEPAVPREQQAVDVRRPARRQVHQQRSQGPLVELHLGGGGRFPAVTEERWRFGPRHSRRVARLNAECGHGRARSGRSP